MLIQELINPARVAFALAVETKVDLLRAMSRLMSQGGVGLDAERVYAALEAREHLGSTGIGNGIALPHGRVNGLARAQGAFALLSRALDYDAIDHKPVTMVFALIVPESATDEHLRILSGLAMRFGEKSWRLALAESKDPQELYQRLSAPVLPSVHDTQSHHQRPL